MKNFIKSLFAVLLVVIGFSFNATAQRNVKVTQSFQFTPGASAGKVFVSDATGKASWSNAASANTTTSNTIFTPATQDTVSCSNGVYSILKPSGSLGRVYISFPATPADGEFIMLKTTANIDTVTYVNGTAGNSLKSSLSATDYLKAVYSEADSTWY